MKKLLFGFVLFMALLGGNFMLYHMFLPIRVAYQIIALIFIVGALLRRGLPNSPLTIGAALMALAVVLSMLGAIDLRMASENGWHWIINLLILLMLIHLVRAGYAPTLFYAQLATGLMVAAVAILQFLANGQRPGSLFVSINLTGAYLAALIVPTASYIPQATRRGRWALLAAIGLMAIAILMNQSRGAVISVGVSVAAFVFMRLKTAFQRATMAVGAIALTGLIVLILNLNINHPYGDVLRLDLWRAGGELINTTNTGVGPGLFGQAYRLIGHNPNEDRFIGAHNAYINVGAELGGPGLMAGAVLILLGLYCVFESKPSLTERAALAALLGVGAHMLFDSSTSNNFALLLGTYAAMATYQATGFIKGRAVQLAGALATVGMIVYTLPFVTYNRAQLEYERAYWTGRYYDAYQAHLIDPDNRLYSLELLRLTHQDLSAIDPTLKPSTDLMGYGLTNYGRIFK